MTRDTTVVGWREWLRLPEPAVDSIKAKVDTGARTSALHAENVRVLEDGRGHRTVHFTVHPEQRSRRKAVAAVARLVGERRVTSSSGAWELRPVIRTLVSLGGLEWPIEITLTRRDVMGFRMLIGRQALRGRAIVDPGRSYLTRAPEGAAEEVVVRPLIAASDEETRACAVPTSPTPATPQEP